MTYDTPVTPEVRERPESPRLVREKKKEEQQQVAESSLGNRPDEVAGPSGDKRPENPAAKPRHCPPCFYTFYFLFLCRNALLPARNVAVHSASVNAGTRRSVSPKEFLNQRCNYCPPSAQTQLDLQWLDKQMLPDSYKLYTYGQIIDLRFHPPAPFFFFFRRKHL